jgi:hypothetical protein
MISMTEHYLHQQECRDTKFDLPSHEGNQQASSPCDQHSFGFLQALTEQLGSLCACSTSFETPSMVVDYSDRHWIDMVASINARSVIANYYSGQITHELRHRGGQDEYKECEKEDYGMTEKPEPHAPSQTSTRMVMDESMILHRDFYKRGNMFASSAIGFFEEDESIMLSVGTCKKVRTVSPAPDTPPPTLRPRVALPPAEIVEAIPIEDDSETLDQTGKNDSPAAAMLFHDIPFYTRTPDTIPPPITSVDTCTTVSTCRSDSSLLDIEDDDGDIIFVHRLSDSPRVVSDCFRLGTDAYATPPPPDRTISLSPPRCDKSRYLLRMKPSNYIHGIEDCEEYGRVLTMPALR